MLAPYCMIHFGKPWPEAAAALPAGLVLGTLALGTRSIASGVVLHVTVALGMDLMALAQQGALPTRLWP
jgi:membrane protease YdiL (CAAX protease family)